MAELTFHFYYRDKDDPSHLVLTTRENFHFLNAPRVICQHMYLAALRRALLPYQSWYLQHKYLSYANPGFGGRNKVYPNWEKAKVNGAVLHWQDIGIDV